MKSISKFFVSAFLVTLFVSCGGDDPVDYTLKDLDVLAGTYTGKCTITPSGSSVSPYTIDNASVRLVRTSAANTMALETSESGLISQDILSNFKSTTDETAYTFNISGFNFKRTNLAYINGWFPSTAWSNISEVTITVNSSNDARYTKSSKTLTFSYTATATFSATPLIGAASQQSVPLKYSYTVVKQ
jgi:hypothetical protein